MELAARVAPLTLARERCLPVHEVFEDLLPDAGLVRGRVVACGGDAALTLALALAAGPSAAGSWLAVVGVPELGVEAAGDLGVAIERVVAVDVDPRRPQAWAERVAAAADGVELILTTVPPGADRWWRKVHQRVQQRGVVVLTVPSATAIVAGRAGEAAGADLQVSARTLAWEGIGEGWGRLCRRRVRLRVAGRRSPRPVTGECWLPGASGAPEPIRPTELDDTAPVPVPARADRDRRLDDHLVGLAAGS